MAAPRDALAALFDPASVAIVGVADDIEAVDINPLIIGAEGCTAVDGLIVPRTAVRAAAQHGDGSRDAFDFKQHRASLFALGV